MLVTEPQIILEILSKKSHALNILFFKYFFTEKHKEGEKKEGTAERDEIGCDVRPRQDVRVEDEVCGTNQEILWCAVRKEVLETGRFVNNLFKGLMCYVYFILKKSFSNVICENKL